ncbi:MAG: hypothetical protein WAN65_13710 [Candidatus Sulfotelmatobacter sp.]
MSRNYSIPQVDVREIRAALWKMQRHEDGAQPITHLMVSDQFYNERFLGLMEECTDFFRTVVKPRGKQAEIVETFLGFRICPNSCTPEDVIEVWGSGEFLGAIQIGAPQNEKVEANRSNDSPHVVREG